MSEKDRNNPLTYAFVFVIIKFGAIIYTLVKFLALIFRLTPGKAVPEIMESPEMDPSLSLVNPVCVPEGDSIYCFSLRLSELRPFYMS